MKILADLTWLILIAATTLGSEPSFAHNLLGGAAVTEQTATGAEANPAMAAMIRRSEIEFSPTVGTDVLMIRYPGFASTVESRTQVGIETLLPKLVVKPSPCFGFGITEILPPANLNIKLKKLPLLLLGQPNQVDIEAKGQSHGGAGGYLGWCVTKSIHLGFKAHYRNVSARAITKSSETGGKLLAVDVAQESLVASSGILMNFGKTSVGITMDLIQYQKSTIGLDVNLGESGQQAPIAMVGSSLLSNIVVGMKTQLGDTEGLVDLAYSRAPKNAKDFSSVDLKEKRKDIYDTLGVKAGARHKLTSDTRILVGGAYEPAAIGPGGRGEESLSGFGLTDILMVYTGVKSLTPAWQMSVGFEHILGDLRFGAGVSRRVASFGVDENGEQPGAYHQKQITIPMMVAYKFGGASKSQLSAR